MECHVISTQWLVRNDYVVAKWFYGDKNLHKFDHHVTSYLTMEETGNAYF